MTYEWTNGARFPAEAQAIGERVERIRQKHDGEVRPEHIVKDAQAKSSPLHCCFEWNDRRAAESYRLDQARLVIRSLTVVIDERQQQPIRAFVAVQSTKESTEDQETTGKSYVGIVDAMNDPLLREQIVDSALRELQVWRQKYRQLTELARLFSVVDEQLEIDEVVRT